METNILIAGDTCPIGRNEILFQEGDSTSLLNDLLPEFEQADLSIINLESPLILEKSPIQKIGPNFGVSIDCVKGLKAMKVGVVGLANNHIMDHGSQGLLSTIQALDAQGIAHVGAGEDLSEARTILVQEVNGLRIGILAVAEYEFGIAAINTPGANPMDVIDFVRNTHEHRFEYDTLIVLVHGGNEHYSYPHPLLMDTCRFFIEQGAGAVICQHSHRVGCAETYKGSPIIYGQGNFLFDMPSPYPSWKKGCLVKLSINLTGDCSAQLIPFHQSSGNPGARRMSLDDEFKWHFEFNERSNYLSNPQIIEEKWRLFCRDRKRYYLHTLHGKPSLCRRLLGKLDLLHVLDNSEKQRARLNIIRCESHREALRTILESEIDR